MKQLAEFALYPQDAPDWCWAAVVQMIQHYYLSTHQSQAEIMHHCCGGVSCTNSGTSERVRRCPHPCLAGLEWQVTGRNRHLPWETICAELDAERPVIITWADHSVICIGYERLGRVLTIYNPLPVGRGRIEMLPYHDYTNLFNSESWYAFQAISPVANPGLH